MKKAFYLLFIVLFLLLSVSCGIESTELANRLIIECIGIDIDGDEYVLSIQILNTSHVGLKSGFSPTSVTKSHEVRGKTVSDAINRFSSLSGKQVMNSHNSLIIFGRELAEKGISGAMDYFLRSHSSRSKVKVAVAEKTAKEIVLANYGESIPGAKILEDVFKEGLYYSIIPSISVYEVVNRLSDSVSDCYIPIIGLESSENTEEALPRSDETAVFVGDKMVGTLDKDETKGFMWASDQINRGEIVTIPQDNLRFSLDIVNSSTKINIKNDNGQPYFYIEIECICDVVECQKDNFDGLSSGIIEIAKKSAEEEIIRQTRMAIDKAALEFGSDIFRFGRRLWLAQPQLFRELNNDWSAQIKQLDTHISAKVDIRLLGQEAIGK